MGLAGKGRHVHWARDLPAADTAAVVTLAAVENHRHCVREIHVSYRGGTPTGAGITVTVGGTTIYQLDLPLANNTVQIIPFDDGLYLDTPAGVNAAMVITATDPGVATSCAAKLNVCHDVAAQT